jgi:hypothetical protein
VKTTKQSKNRRPRSHSRRISIADLLGHHRGAMAQFARDLSRVSGQNVTWDRVNHQIRLLMRSVTQDRRGKATMISNCPMHKPTLTSVRLSARVIGTRFRRQ